MPPAPETAPPQPTHDLRPCWDSRPKRREGVSTGTTTLREPVDGESVTRVISVSRRAVRKAPRPRPSGETAPKRRPAAHLLWAGNTSAASWREQSVLQEQLCFSSSCVFVLPFPFGPSKTVAIVHCFRPAGRCESNRCRPFHASGRTRSNDAPTATQISLDGSWAA